MALDPIANTLLGGLAQVMPEVGSCPAPDLRTKFEAVGAMLTAPTLACATSDEQIEVNGGQVTVRIYRPPVDGPRPAVAYFHGGGWVVGRLVDYDAVLDDLAIRTGCLVASVDYRMAPEWKFPTAVQDCYAATVWLVKNADALGVDVSRIAVAGDSSGGNLAAAVALMARDQGGPVVAFQVLVYPVARCHVDAASYVQGVDTPPLTTKGMAWYTQQYLGSRDDADHPYASPVLSADLSGLPPALLITAGVDPLREDALELGRRLEAADVSVTTSHYSDMFHGFYSFRGMLAQGDQAFEEVVAALRTRLAGRHGPALLPVRGGVPRRGPRLADQRGGIAAATARSRRLGGTARIRHRVAAAAL
jgi:acetyl esterase/lipase